MLDQREIIRKWGDDPLSVWRLTSPVRQRLASQSTAVDVKEQILRILKAQGKEGLKNAQIREISGASRTQVKRIMNALQNEGLVRLEGKGNTARWIYIVS